MGKLSRSGIFGEILEIFLSKDGELENACVSQLGYALAIFWTSPLSCLLILRKKLKDFPLIL